MKKVKISRYVGIFGNGPTVDTVVLSCHMIVRDASVAEFNLVGLAPEVEHNFVSLV